MYVYVRLLDFYEIKYLKRFLKKITIFSQV